MAHHYSYFAAFVCGIILGSCATTGSGADGLILSHQRQIDELESRNQDLERRLTEYDRTVGSSIQELKSIGERARGVEGTVDELIDLFGEYQRRVDELTRAYNAIQDQAVTNDQTDANSIGSGGA
jgi:chromosome segregation ATPase